MAIFRGTDLLQVFLGVCVGGGGGGHFQTDYFLGL